MLKLKVRNVIRVLVKFFAFSLFPKRILFVLCCAEFGEVSHLNSCI